MLVIDGHEFPDDDSNLIGDGKYPPFYIFDSGLQDNIAGPVPTRNAAEKLLGLVAPYASYDPWDVSPPPGHFGPCRLTHGMMLRRVSDGVIREFTLHRIVSTLTGEKAYGLTLSTLFGGAEKATVTQVTLSEEGMSTLADLINHRGQLSDYPIKETP